MTPRHENLALPLSAKAARTGEQPISFLIETAMANQSLINLAAGLVDPLTLPIDAMRKISQALLADDARARAALQYDTTQGLEPLRRACVRHLSALEEKPAADFGISPRDIVITTGSQQALYLIGDVLIDPGDIVIAANPCYFVYTGTLKSLGATVMAVPMTDSGIDVDAVEELLKKLETQGRLDRLKLIYTTSYFQNPTGLTLNLEGRGRLLELARKFSRCHRLLILEDAAYRELRYDGPNLPSIKSMDRENRYTILTQTFSKPFAPGLKTGYTAMPADLLKAVLNQKGNHDFGSASLTQHLALEAMNTGLYHQQVRHLCDSYGQKRDRMLEALQRHMPRDPEISWTRPSGGLYIWLTLPDYFQTSREAPLFNDSVRRGVMYVPGEYGFQPDEAGFVPSNHLRLSFGQVAPERIEPGIQRLAEAVGSLSRTRALEAAHPAPLQA
jgi:2-aminoadipate transaminase